MKCKVALVVAALLSVPFVVSAEDLRGEIGDDGARARMGDMRDETQLNKMIDESAEVYRSIVRGGRGIPANTLKNARCIAVLPGVVTGALVLGGTHGEGLASCKDDENMWSQPAPISLNQGSFGLQAGAKSTDVVLFFQTREAVSALKRGDFSLGADVSAVAGNFDSSVDTSAAGVVVFTRTEGLFAGASVNGSKIGKDDDEISNFYGKKANYRSILEGKESPDVSGYTLKFTELLP